MADAFRPDEPIYVTLAEAKAAGAKTWTPDSPCNQGHWSDRYVSRNRCVECSKAYVEKNKAAVMAQKAEYREKNRGQINATAREKRGVSQRSLILKASAAARAEAVSSGQTMYLGHPCRRGHDGRRYTCNGNCVGCRVDYIEENYVAVRKSQAEYHANNKDILNAKAKELRDANPEQTKAKAAASRHKRQAKIRARNREKYHADIDASRAVNRAFAAKRTPEQKQDLLVYHKAWRTENPEKFAASQRTHRVRKRNAEGSHSGDDILALFKRQKGRCAYCRASLKDGYEVDHIIPLAKGGTNWIRNIQLTCMRCNRKKHAKDPIKFARESGLLL